MIGGDILLKEKFMNIKSLVAVNQNGNNKKKIENLVVFVILLIIVIIAINTIWKDNKKEEPSDMDNSNKQLAADNITNTDALIDSNVQSNASTDLEKNLEAILSKLNGVGEVSVLITYSETSEVISMYNESIKSSTTEELDTSGGRRTIEQKDSSKDIAYQEESGVKTPITQKIVLPKVVGAIVIAEGAESALVKANIIQAVEAVTGLPIHKIQVFEMK